MSDYPALTVRDVCALWNSGDRGGWTLQECDKEITLRFGWKHILRSTQGTHFIVVNLNPDGTVEPRT